MRRAEYPSGRTDIRPTVQEQRDQGLLNHTRAGDAYPNSEAVVIGALVAIVGVGTVVWA